MSDESDFKESVRCRLEKGHTFRISFRKEWGPYPPGIRHNILATQIKPLLIGAEGCLLYGGVKIAAAAREKLGEIVTIRSRQLVVNDALASLTLCPALWEGTGQFEGRTLLWKMPIGRFSTVQFLDRMHTPMVVRNSSVTFDRAALAMAREWVNKDPRSICFLLSKTNPLDYVCLITDLEWLVRLVGRLR